MKERKRKEKKGRYRGRRKKVFFSVFILLDYDIGIKLYDYIDKMNNERKDNETKFMLKSVLGEIKVPKIHNSLVCLIKAIWGLLESSLFAFHPP